jgi:diacylglycerol kinase family enzyme
MDALTRAGLAPEFFATLPEGGTVDSLAARVEKGDAARVVYLGGDGTFADAAKAIILARERSGVDIPLGMLPMGTANDQGRSFGVMAGERALEDNVRIVAAGLEQWLDAGRVEALGPDGESLAEDLWFDSWGLGLSAQILAARNRDRELVGKVPVLRRLYRDKLVYTGAAVRSLAQSVVGRPHFAAEITIDGEPHEYTGITDLLVKGTILYAGDWIFDSESQPDDGKFEVVIVKGHADWAAAAIARHKHNPVTDDDREVLGLPLRQVEHGKLIEVRVFRPKALDSIECQIDGEEFAAADHYRIENLFHHLRVIVPEDAHWV